MAIYYACSMDHYGDSDGSNYDGSAGNDAGWLLDNDVMLGDGWSSLPTYTRRPGGGPGSGNEVANGLYTIGLPSFGARRGDRALIADGVAIHNTNDNSARIHPDTGVAMMFAIPGDTAATRYIHLAFGIDQLPALSAGMGGIVDFFNAAGTRRCALKVDPSGRISLYRGTGLTWLDTGYVTTPEVIATTAAPVISAGTWYSLNIEISATGDFKLYVGDIDPGNLVISLSGATFTSTGNIDILGFLPASADGDTMANDTTERAIRDIVLTDSSGSYNTGLLGQVFVSAQEMRAANAGGGWGIQPRENFSTGILDSVTTQTGVRLADTTALDIGTQDFTLETMLRFNTIPDASTGQEMDIISRWRDNTSDRSYRLYYDGATGSLKFDVSIDGINTVTVKDIPWDAEKWKWYHVAVSRWTDTSGTYTSLFVNGVELGIPTADTNDYFDASAALGIAARFNGTTTLVSDSVFDGWLDETRVTIGVARYSAAFTPPATLFPRNVIDDTDFNSVVLLMGYDGAIIDESDVGRTVVSTLEVLAPGDNEYDYQVLNQRPPWDDTYAEATNYTAQSILTLLANPTDGETITIGTQTYTLVTAFDTVETDQVLIGATVTDTLDNLTAAINGAAGEGTLYGTGTVANTDAVAVTYKVPQLIIRAQDAGASTVATTETLANGYFDGATLSGGTDIPDDIDWQIERLPIDATGVLGIQVTARASKSDAGSASMRFDLVGPAGTVDTGDSKTPDLTPSWQRQVYEEDPDTSVGITPSTVVAGRIRFTRTA